MNVFKKTIQRLQEFARVVRSEVPLNAVYRVTQAIRLSRAQWLALEILREHRDCDGLPGRMLRIEVRNRSLGVVRFYAQMMQLENLGLVERQKKKIPLESGGAIEETRYGITVKGVKLLSRRSHDVGFIEQ